MNTRLQVEHPVTEMITGIDLVREQIRIAAGLPLSFKQKDVTFEGHAIEVRVNAENPRTFTPSPGRVVDFHAPGGLGVRLDSAIYSGYQIPPYYDSLIGKLIVHAHDRALGDGGMRAQNFLNFERRHLETTGLDDVHARPAQQAIRAALEHRHVAGTEPAVTECSGGLLRPLPILVEHIGAADFQPAGRAVDHIGFEVKNLQEFLARLEAQGIKPSVTFRRVDALGINIAFIVDPWGTNIELTEGLDKIQ
jgi:hypothetical protein